MTGLRYVGADVSLDTDVVYRDYSTSVKTADLTVTQIDDAINTGLLSYVDKSYVDAQDALNATAAYIDAGDNARIKTATKDLTNGVAGLDANSRVLSGKILDPGDQKWHRGPWSPTTVNAAAVTASAEATVFSCGVTDPGFPYKLLVFGSLDCQVNSDNGEYPVVSVRAGDAVTGEIIAAGRGLGRSYQGIAGIDPFDDATHWNSVSNGGISALSITGGVANSDSLRRMGEWNGAQPQSDSLYLKWQIVGGTTGNEVAQGGMAVYLCGNSNWTNYMGLDITTFSLSTQHDFAQFFSGGTNPVSGRTDRGSEYDPGGGFRYGDTCEVRYDPLTNQFTFWHNGSLGITYTDSSNHVAHGSTNRRVAIMTNSHNSGASFPGGDFDNVVIGNGLYAAAPVKLIPAVTQSVKTGATTLYVRLSRSGTASTVTATTFDPRLYVLAVAA